MSHENEKAIVLFSGGQDSTTCLFWAKKKFKEVVAVGFNYGQKHLVEVEYAQQIADIAGVEYVLLDAQGLLGGSSLTDHSQSTAEQHQVNPQLPSSFTAGRNALFLTIAGSYGYGRGINNIVTGVCQTDFSGYPDCRDVFVKSQEVTLSLALDSPVTIHTPLMWLTKAETWKLAADLGRCNYLVPGVGVSITRTFDVVGIIRDLTLTDYNGSTKMNEWGMGELNNPASELRAKGYFEAVERGWI